MGPYIYAYNACKGPLFICICKGRSKNLAQKEERNWAFFVAKHSHIL